MNNDIAQEKPLIKIELQEKGVLVTIITSRCLIKSYKTEDYDKCLSLYGDPLLSKYFDYGKPKTEEEVRDLIKNRSEEFQKERIPLGLFSIFDKFSGEFIGQCDLFPTGEPGVLEVGCILHKHYQNNGIGTEVVRALMHDYVVFLNMNGITYNGKAFEKVIGTAHPSNKSSNKLINKLGMAFEREEMRFGHPRGWFIYNVTAKSEK